MSKKEVQTEQVAIAKLDNFSTVNEMHGLAQTLIDGKMIPTSLNTPEKVISVIQLGRELGLGAVSSLNNIHNIQGRTTLSVHAISALLYKAGVAYKILKDFEQFDKPKIEADGSISTVKDIETIIRFYRKWNGETIENDIRFTWSEAQLAGLTTKDNWKKMPKIMMRSRCLTIGARFCGPDFMVGMYEASEWADVKNVPITLDEEGEIISID
jgi:hypothetical protein